ncbi:glycoside hydrolase family 2 TIM barrel-domain containing protein [Pedobacter helvus]|mgnify:CR=1 FL=1|uniref:Glycoside hydrolase family 2 TIM barrel-domain containing protein n=1 Tax=Pedobacter helvus TaxID=2563444 RepID=A0ABW9JRH4_9SPHI|nr:glycoside hydrolase family 2 TIM barrel-domain containing protein [Pedobacter ureilyticus]
MRKLLAFLVLIAVVSCRKEPALSELDGLEKSSSLENTLVLNSTPSVVTVVKESGIWKLKRNGQNYIVKGVAASKALNTNITNYITALKSFSGNTIRTYSVNEFTQDILDEAYANGISVCLGLWVNREADNFNYNDTVAVNQQLLNLKAQVLAYKDHPALLMWGVGNEVDASYTNLKVWNAINDIASMIHTEDGNHPVTTMLANTLPAKITEIKNRAPQLDLICSNTYAPNLPAVTSNLQQAGWTKPYMITEFGPRGTWQMNPEPTRILPWGALVEQTSTEKAEIYRSSYNQHIKANFNNGCLGSFAFVWGYQTHGAVLTWFGFHTTEGRTFGAADIMKRVWSDWYPANRAPEITSRNDMTLAGQHAEDAIYLAKGSTKTAAVTASDPENDPLVYEWRIVPEGVAGPGGVPHPGLTGLITSNGNATVSFTVPSTAGAYRLYVYVKDNHNKVASAVIPFYAQ